MIDLDDSPVHRNFNLFKSSVMVVISKIIRMYASMYWSSWGWHHSNTAHNVLLNTNLSVFLNLLIGKYKSSIKKYFTLSKSILNLI